MPHPAERTEAKGKEAGAEKWAGDDLSCATSAARGRASQLDVLAQNRMSSLVYARSLCQSTSQDADYLRAGAELLRAEDAREPELVAFSLCPEAHM